MSKLVRINPVNPGQGYHARRYAMPGKYGTFKVERGWYTVDDKTAAYLATKLNNPADDRSRPIFQVVTVEEARAVKKAEEERKRREDPDNPVPLPPGVDEFDDDSWGEEDWGGDPEVDHPADSRILDGADDELDLPDLPEPELDLPEPAGDLTTSDLSGGATAVKAPPKPKAKAKTAKAPARKARAKKTKATKKARKTARKTPKKG